MPVLVWDNVAHSISANSRLKRVWVSQNAPLLETICDRKELRQISILNHPGHYTITERPNTFDNLQGVSQLLDKLDKQPSLLTVSEDFMRSIKEKLQVLPLFNKYFLQLPDGKDLKPH